MNKLEKEEIKPTGKTFQLLERATAKDFKPQSISSMTWNNNVAMSSGFQSRSTGHQRSSRVIVNKISRGRTMQALKHNHTQLVCHVLWV